MTSTRAQEPVTRPAPDSERMLEVLKQFRVLLKSIKRHYQWVEEECGLSGAQIWAMAEIAASPGLKVSELAARLAIHLSTASNLLRRLEQLGFAERSRIGDDQRTVQVRLSAKGKSVLRKAPRPLVGLLQQALSQLPAATLRSLHRDLAEVIHQMKFKDASARSRPLSDL